MQCLRGVGRVPPRDHAAMYHRFKRRYAFEHCHRPFHWIAEGEEPRRTGWTRRRLQGVASRLAARGPKISRVEADCREVGCYYHEVILAASSGGRKLSAHEARQFQLLSKVAEQSLDAYRELKIRRANTLANLGEMAIAPIAAFGVAFLGLPYTPVALVVSASLYSARYLVKTAALGEGYGRRDAMIDRNQALIGGTTLALSGWLRNLSELRVIGQLQQYIGSGLRPVLNMGLKVLNRNLVSTALLRSGESGYARLMPPEVDAQIEFVERVDAIRERAAARRYEALGVPEVALLFRRLGKRVAARSAMPAAR